MPLPTQRQPLFYYFCAAFCALILPVSMLLLGFLLPFANAATLTQLLHLADTISFKIALLAVITLPMWYGLHRLLQLNQQLAPQAKRSKLLFYGLACAWSLQTIYVLFGLTL